MIQCDAIGAYNTDAIARGQKLVVLTLLKALDS